MEITVKQGDLQVIATGTVVVINNEETIFSLDKNYHIKINYIDDSKDKKQGLLVLPIENGILIRLINFNNPFGSATNKYIPVAVTEEDKILMSLNVIAYNETLKVVTYGIYLDKKDAEHGGNKK